MRIKGIAELQLNGDFGIKLGWLSVEIDKDAARAKIASATVMALPINANGDGGSERNSGR